MKKIKINISKCTGCNQCVLTCSFVKSGTFDPRQSRIRIVQWEDRCLSVPIMCQQCEDANCIAVCPTNALTHDPDTGVIVLDAVGCINCDACAVECTYQVMHMTTDGLPVTCDLCGGDPECVKVCYPGALTFEEVPDAEREPLRSLAETLNARSAGQLGEAPAELLERATLAL